VLKPGVSVEEFVEEKLKNFFGKFGEVVMLEKEKNGNSWFITFTHAESAAIAIKHCDHRYDAERIKKLRHPEYLLYVKMLNNNAIEECIPLFVNISNDQNWMIKVKEILKEIISPKEVAKHLPKEGNFQFIGLTEEISVELATRLRQTADFSHEIPVSLYEVMSNFAKIGSLVSKKVDMAQRQKRKKR